AQSEMPVGEGGIQADGAFGRRTRARQHVTRMDAEVRWRYGECVGERGPGASECRIPFSGLLKCGDRILDRRPPATVQVHSFEVEIVGRGVARSTGRERSRSGSGESDL